LVFGEVADTYDRRRPSYPAVLVEAILDFADIEPGATTPVAEVGAGTGNASVLFAAHGLKLTCVEPSEPMASIARRNLASFPNAEVVHTSFEDWQPPANEFGLVYAAQSWHWISRQVRTAKAYRVLRPGGTLAIFWNVIARRGGDGLDTDLAAVYGDLIQETMWRSAPAERLEVNNWAIGEIESSGLFEDLTVLQESWQATYDTDAWMELLSTASDHRMLDKDARAGLFDRVRAAVDANGRSVEVEYVSVGYLARARQASGQLQGDHA
jgi:SAM-dependent methyltransferase